jgi:hypothetical protein
MKERCRLPHSPPVPTLLLRVPADETYGALIFSRVASYLIIRVYGILMHPLTKASNWADRQRGHVFGLIVGDVAYFGWLLLELPILFVHFLLRCLLSFPVDLVAGAALLLFGYEFIPLAGQILISAESSPPGTWQITYLSPLDRVEDRILHRDRYNLQ